MRIPVERMLSGVSRTLLEQVLPHVEPRAARGQLYAAIEVLRNLERRVEWARAPLEVEATSIADALRAAAERLRADGAGSLADALEAGCADWPAEAKPRATAAREALNAAFAALADAPPALADPARARLGGHLAAQAVRDLAPLAPGSLLEEISRG